METRTITCDVCKKEQNVETFNETGVNVLLYLYNNNLKKKVGYASTQNNQIRLDVCSDCLAELGIEKKEQGQDEFKETVIKFWNLMKEYCD